MEKKSSVNDIYKHISSNDLSELHKTLDTKLGADNPFAKFSTGAGFYVWSDNRCEWHRMVDANSLKQSFVREAIDLLKEDISKKNGEKTTEALFTTPDDSYIYYNDEGGNVKILIAGWGFKKPVRPSIHGREETHLRAKNHVCLSFSCDGEIKTNYAFGIRLGNYVKSLSTDASGKYDIEDMKVGEKFVVTDFNSQRDFPIEIVEGQSLYIIDVTHQVGLHIEAKIGDKPLAGESVKVEFHGKNYEATTDKNGQAEILLPLHNGEEVTATMRDTTQTTTLAQNGGKMVFAFEEPTIELPKTQLLDIKVVVTKDGEPLASQPVTVTYGNTNLNVMTDAAGVFTTQVDEIPGEMCHVSTPGYEPQSKLLEANILNEFVFETQPEEVPPLPSDIKIMVRDQKGERIECSNIVFRQENKPELTATLDENGDTSFPSGRFDIDTPITAQINGWPKTGQLEPIKFSLEKDEYEYLLQEKEPIAQTDWKNVALEVLAVVVAAVLLIYPIWFYFLAFCAGMFNLIY